MFLLCFKTYQSHFTPNRTDTDFPKHKFNNGVAGILGDMVIKTEQYHREGFMLFLVMVDVNEAWDLDGVVLSSVLRDSGGELLQWSDRVPSLSDKRTLFNRSFLISTNSLWKFGRVRPRQTSVNEDVSNSIDYALRSQSQPPKSIRSA